MTTRCENMWQKARTCDSVAAGAWISSVSYCILYLSFFFLFRHIGTICCRDKQSKCKQFRAQATNASDQIIESWHSDALRAATAHRLPNFQRIREVFGGPYKRIRASLSFLDVRGAAWHGPGGPRVLSGLSGPWSSTQQKSSY